MTEPGGTTAARRPPGECRPARNPARTRGKRYDLLPPLGVVVGHASLTTTTIDTTMIGTELSDLTSRTWA